MLPFEGGWSVVRWSSEMACSPSQSVSCSVKKSKNRLARALCGPSHGRGRGCTQLDIRTDSPKSERAETEMESRALKTPSTDAPLSFHPPTYVLASLTTPIFLYRVAKNFST